MGCPFIYLTNTDTCLQPSIFYDHMNIGMHWLQMVE